MGRICKNMSCSDLAVRSILTPPFPGCGTGAGLQLFIGYLCALDAQHLLAPSLWPWEEGLFIPGRKQAQIRHRLGDSIVEAAARIRTSIGYTPRVLSHCPPSIPVPRA